MNETNEIITPKEVAELLRVHPMTVYRYVKEKKIPFFNTGGSIRFVRKNVNKWIQNQHKS